MSAGISSGCDTFGRVPFASWWGEGELILLVQKLTTCLFDSLSAEVPVHHCYITNQIADVSLLIRTTYLLAIPSPF